MESYQLEFLRLAHSLEALRFGEFTLKSGRTSPYFFNAGLLSTGAAMSALGRGYAAAIMATSKAASNAASDDASKDEKIDFDFDFDCLFGPAYKGIPVAAVTAAALADIHGVDLPWAYNRKEKKDHGEGGTLVGANLSGRRVLIVDDVITAGTAIRESIEMIRAAGGEPVAVAVALDRQERGAGQLSAIQELQEQEGLAVVSLVTLKDLVGYLRSDESVDAGLLARVEAYRDEFGVG